MKKIIIYYYNHCYNYPFFKMFLSDYFANPPLLTIKLVREVKFTYLYVKN